MLALLRGFVAGFVLSCLRAPLGLDLFQDSVVAGKVGYGWRAAAIAVVALGLFIARKGSLPARVLLATCLGFALHGLLLANLWAPSDTLLLGLTAVIALGAFAALRPAVESSGPRSPSPKLLEMLGLAAAGAGATLAVEAIARHMRLFEGGLARDDSVSGAIALAILALGAAAFGWIGRRGSVRGLALPVALAAASAACFLSELVARRLSDPLVLAPSLHRIGLEPSWHGSLGYDAAISVALLAAPLLLLGAALPAAGGRNRLFSVLVGASLALALFPSFLELAPGATAKDPQPSISELVPMGSLVAAGGALLAILSISDRGAIARWSGIGASLAAALPALLVKVNPLHIVSPWLPYPVFPVYLTDAPEGLVTVESFGLLGGSWTFATVDRRCVTPEIEDALADALRLRASIELVPADRRATGNLSVLLVGQLSPERARVLLDGGVGRIDRTASWSSSMPNVEEALWGSLTEERAKPEGEILSPGEARVRMRRGDYDLVISAAVPGDPPSIRPSGAPATTVVVRWIDLDEPIANHDLGERVALILDGLERPALGVLEHTAAAGDGPYAPLVVRAGTPGSASTPIALLLARPGRDDVARAAHASIAARLAAAERGGPLEIITAGFDEYFAAQLAVEDPAAGIELSDACLDRFRAAALAGEPDPTVRRTWDTLAHVLAGQREAAKIETYVRPIAEKHRAWDALEKALARADLESRKPEEAVRRLDPMRISSPDDFELWTMLGEAHCQRGDAKLAIESWGRALTIVGIDRTRRREIAMILAGFRAPEAQKAAAEFLGEFPDDHELAAKLTEDPAGRPETPCPR